MFTRIYFGEYVVLILMFSKVTDDRAVLITTAIPFFYSKGTILMLLLRLHKTLQTFLEIFFDSVSYSYCRSCYQLTCLSLKIFCANVWRERKVCITFALANDREGVARERVGRERKTRETKARD